MKEISNKVSAKIMLNNIFRSFPQLNRFGMLFKILGLVLFINFETSLRSLRRIENRSNESETKYDTK